MTNAGQGNNSNNKENTHAKLAKSISQVQLSAKKHKKKEIQNKCGLA